MKISALNKSNQNPPILIVDKIGMIGEALARHFAKDYLVVLLSEKLLSKDNTEILHVPFRKKIPEVPDNEYSKIFIIDDGTNVVRESAFSFINKALENNAPLYFIGSIRNVDVEHSDEIAKSYKEAKVLIFGDLFDNGLVFDKTSSINKFILDAREEDKIKIIGDGLSLSFPITFIDTIKLIIKATELSLDQQVILLFSATPITDIALASLFKKAKPTINIEFEKGKRIRKAYIPKGAMHAIDKYALEEKIKSLNLGKSSKKEVKTEKRKKQNRIPFLYSLTVILFVLFLPFISTYSLILTGNALFNKFAYSLNHDTVKNALPFANNAFFVFDLSDKTFFVLNKELELFKLNAFSSDLSKKIVSGKYLSAGGVEIGKAVIGFDEIYAGKSKLPKELFYTSSNEFKNGMYLIEKAQSISQLPDDISPAIKSLTPISDLLSNSSDMALELLGFNNEKKYLVVELNKNNIEPVGGGVDMAKLISIKNGRIVSEKTINLHSLSAYEGPSIDTPFFASRYGSVENASIENSVYKIGFSLNAKDIADIYSFASSEGIDGVIGVSSGEFDSLQKASTMSLLTTIGNGILKKDIIMSALSTEVDEVLGAHNLSATLLDNRQNSSGVVNDYFGIIEASFDKNNSNNISRTVSKNVKINSSGALESSLTAVFKNSGDRESQIYVQVLTPGKSNISEIKIDDFIQKIIPAVTNPNVFTAKNFKEPKGLEVDQYSESGKDVAGFLIKIPANGLRTVTFTYSLPYLIQSTDDSFVYSLSFYKQPIVPEYNIGLTFNYPVSYQILNPKPEYNFNLDQDKSFIATFSKK